MASLRPRGDLSDEEDIETSEIVGFFKGKNVFLTGATGYLGKVVLEKLLRTCNSLNKIYITVRAKKGKDVQARFKEIFEGPNMENLKRKHPNYTQKVVLMNGDCLLPDMGLDKENKQTLISEVDVIIHCAATVRFDQDIRRAAYINVRSVLDLITMAKQMRNLKAFLHVSTAYSFCTHQHIGEEIYEPPLAGDKLLSLVESLDDEKLKKITPIILEGFPNTYVFTKAIAETVVKKYGQSLPIAIFRPSTVVASVSEPVAGWIDNAYGATGSFMAAALGVIRTIQARSDCMSEIVPADYSMNSAIAAVWYTAKSWSENTEIKFQTNIDGNENPVVYNYVSTPEAPLTWGRFKELCEKHASLYPTEFQVWHYFYHMRASKTVYQIEAFFLHTVPAYIIDILLFCIGKKPQAVKSYKQITKFLAVIGFFAIQTWHFNNNNVQSLWTKIPPVDQKLFPFSMKNFDWDEYFGTFTKGARVYLLKDPMETLAKGRIKYNKLMVAHYVLVSVILLILYKLLSLVFRSMF